MGFHKIEYVYKVFNNMEQLELSEICRFIDPEFSWEFLWVEVE